MEVIGPLLVGGFPHGRRGIQRLFDCRAQSIGRTHMHERAFQELPVVFGEQRLAIAVQQAVGWEVVDDSGLAQGEEVEDRTRGFTHQRIRGRHVRHDVVLARRQQHAVRIFLDPALEDPVLPVRGILSHPAVVMELHDQIVAVLGRREDRVFHFVHARGFVGGRKQHSAPVGIEAPAPQQLRAVPVPSLEVPVQFRQTNQMHLAPSLETGLLEPLHAVTAFDKDLIAGVEVLREVAIQEILDPGAMVEKAEQRPAIGFSVPDRVARDHDIEPPLLLGEPVALADPLIDNRRTVAEVDEEPSHAFLVQGKEDVVAIVAPKQLDQRIERRLVVDESDFEQQPAPGHPAVSPPLPSRT